MSWFEKLIPSRIKIEASSKRAVPEGLWAKCPGCSAVLYRAELERNLEVCPKCGHHHRVGARRRLDSSVFTEGFWGADAYARVDARIFQGLRPSDNTSLIPTVGPNIYLDWRAPTDALGGTLTFDTWNFAVFRSQGTNTQRGAFRL